MADVTIVTPADVVTPPPPIKPGWKTTEFWLTVAANLIGLLIDAGLFPDTSPIAKGLVTIGAFLATMGYSHSRGNLKAAFHGTMRVFLIGFLVFQTSACACSEASHRNDTVCVVERSIVDCSVDAVTSVIPQFIPLVLQLIAQVTGGGGTLDWPALEQGFVNLGVRDGGCLLAEVQGVLAAQGSRVSASPMLVHQAGAYIQGFSEFRAKRWPGIQFKLANGKVL